MHRSVSCRNQYTKDLGRFKMNVYKPEPVRIKQVFRETEDVKRFRVDLRTKPLPGTFYQLALPGYGECPIAVSSFSDSYVDFCVRRVGNVTNALHKLGREDTLFLRGPNGRGYPLSELKKSDVVIVAGGTGVAPVRGLIQYIKHHRSHFGNVEIFLGYKNFEQVMFGKEFDAWNKTMDVNVSLDKPDKRWQGKTGVVTGLLKGKSYGSNVRAVVCGPPVMMKFAVEELKADNVEEQNIFVGIERLMHCGIGKCGHCMVNDKYTCKDGPIFRYSEAKFLND